MSPPNEKNPRLPFLLYKGFSSEVLTYSEQPTLFSFAIVKKNTPPGGGGVPEVVLRTPRT